MENSKIVVQQDGKELILRTGSAPDVSTSTGVEYSGDIQAPADWYEAKKSNKLPINKSTVTVLINKSKITLIINEYYKKDKIKIIGSLSSYDDLIKFGINNEHTAYTNQQLARFLKLNRYYFDSMDENHQVVRNLNSFKALVNQEIENNNDFKGNKKYLFEQKAKTDLKLSFKLNMPVFQGESKKRFIVDIGFDVTDGSVSFWLESPELKDIELRERDLIMEREAARFNGLAIIRS